MRYRLFRIQHFDPCPYVRLRLPITWKENLLPITSVLESFAGLEDAEVVDLLIIPLTQIKTNME